MKAGVIVPCRQFDGPKTIGQLPVGRKRSFHIRRSGADQSEFEIIGKKAYRIQQEPLLPVASSQEGVKFVDDQHSGIDERHQIANRAAHLRSSVTVVNSGVQCAEHFLIKALLVGIRRHLNAHHVHAAYTPYFIETGRMIAEKLLQNLGLARTGQTVQQRARHAVVQWVVEYGIEMSTVIVPGYFLPLRHAHSTFAAMTDWMKDNDGLLIFRRESQPKLADDALRLGRASEASHSSDCTEVA